MRMPPLKTLRGLTVSVVHPPDDDGRLLVDHLRRIGCRAEAHWPIPKTVPDRTDILFLSVDHEHRKSLTRLLNSIKGVEPAVIAVVDYEDPSTLETLFEVGALAALERPVRPFGVLTNLLLARGIWLERSEHQKRLNKLERKVTSMQRIQKAKSILIQIQGITEDAAHQSIRQQAMAKRVSMDDIAEAILNANSLLHSRSDGD